MTLESRIIFFMYSSVLKGLTERGKKLTRIAGKRKAATKYLKKR